MRKFYLIALALFISGCVSARPPVAVEKYTFAYPTPTATVRDIAQVSIKVQRFTAAQAFNTTSMVYSPAPNRMDVYNYHRWMTNPSDMVTDYFLRDLHASGAFGAIFSWRDAVEARFEINGDVTEFLETDGADGPVATLGMTLTMFDTSENELPRRLVFQKRYRAESPMKEKNPQNLADAISRAMERLSVEMIKDIVSSTTEKKHQKM